MREILHKADQRSILIIEKLIKEKSWITVKGLAESLDSSIKTVTDDLDNIKNNWNHMLGMETSPNYGVRIKNKSIGILNSIGKEIFINSIPLTLVQNLFLHPGWTKIDHCEKISISPSLFSQYLKSIRETLNKLEADVKNEGGKYYISSENEMKLRIFLTNFLIEKYEYDDFLSSEEGRILVEIVEKTDRHGLLDSNNIDSEFIYFLNLLKVSLIRENQNFLYGGEMKGGAKDIEMNINMSLIFKIKKLYPNLTLDNLKRLDLFFNKDLYAWESEEEEARVGVLVEELVKEFFKRLQLEQDEEMCGNMIFIIHKIFPACRLFDFEPSPLFNRERYFVNSYKKYNKKAYSIMEELFSDLSQKTKVNASNLLNSFIFWLCTYCPEFMSYKPKKKMLIISDSGASHYNMIKNQIERRFNCERKYVYTECISYENRKEKLNEEYDLIVTTFPLFKETESKTLIITDNIDYKILYQIEELIYENN